MPKQKPQTLLREQDPTGVHFLKRQGGNFWIEGHRPEHAVSHNANAPWYYFPIDEDQVAELFSAVGKQWVSPCLAPQKE